LQSQIKVVEAGDFDYSFKYADRSIINAFLQAEPGYTDILFARGGFITDTSYANIVFGKSGQLYTPAQALLQGTMRQFLLNEGKIDIKEIKVADIDKYDTFQLINAMMNLDESPVYPIGIIRV
jgi:4-amino-4-deoxychorismate lyase